MLTSKGPKLLEYNARFGDPETQVLVPLYGDEFFDLLLRVANGDLAGAAPEAKGAAVTVVLAANGYPGAPRAGDVITGSVRTANSPSRSRRHDLSRRFGA